MSFSFAPLVSFSSRPFRFYTVGFLLSQIALQMQFVGINWHIYEITHSALSLGLIGLFNFIPILLLALLGGNIADKHNRKTIIVITQAVYFIAIITLLMFMWQGYVSALAFYAVGALSAAATTFDLPSRQSLLPHMVPKSVFLNAVSINTSVRQVALVAGPGAAGFLIAFFGIGVVYAVCAILFLLSVFVLLPVRITSQEIREKAKPAIHSIKEGISFVFSAPLIYSTMILDFLVTFFGSAMVLLPVFAKDVLFVGPDGLGILYAAPAVGSIVAALLFSSIAGLSYQGRILLLSVILFGIATVGFGFSTSFILSIIFLAIIGAGDTVSTIIRNSLRQLATPDYLRGRMTAINMIFFVGGPQLGELEAGLLAAVLGAPLSVVVGGVGAVVSAFVISFIFPKLRNYQGIGH